MTMRLLVTIWLGLLTSAFATPLKDSRFDSISNYYGRVMAKLRTHTLFTSQFPARPLVPEVVLEEDNYSYFGKVSNVQAPLHLIVDKRSADILLVWNHDLDRYTETNAVQRAPRLSVPEALARAKAYLDELELPLPSNCVVKLVAFNAGYRSQWEVRWQPEVGGYTYDGDDGPYDQTLVVVFHEDHGFCGYGCSGGYPAPNSIDVKIAKEVAIDRASKVAPLVMKTPFFRSARASGFKVSGVKGAELKITAPNWLLDPARAVWIRNEPPEETRLCWVVTFITVDTVDTRGIKLIPVDIVVYVDAGTGEVVGANFS